MRAGWLAVGLVACGTTPVAPCDPRFDRDADGADDCADCAPDDPAVHPGADETCNGVDDDCDGVVDDAPIDATPEVCNGVDDDCDGAVDEEASDARWLEDADGDGFGADGTAPVCDGGPGWSTVPGDCDDTTATVAPGAPERWNGVDDDCDGAVDRGAVEAAARGGVHGERFLALGQDRAFGWGGDLLGAGGHALVVVTRAPGAETSQAWVADAAVVDGPVRPLATAYAARVTKGLCPTLDVDCGHLRYVAAPFVDVSGDGVPDLVLTSHRLDLGEPGEGRVFAGGAGLVGELDDAADRLTTIVPYRVDLFVPAGPRQPLAADLDGDGVGDLVLARRYDERADVFVDPRNGSALVFAGPVCGGACDPVLGVGEEVARVWGEAGDWLGARVAAGDLDGDGVDDLILGAPFRGDGGAVVAIGGGPDLRGHPSAPETGPGATLDELRGATGARLGAEERALAVGPLGPDPFADVVVGDAAAPRVIVWVGEDDDGSRGTREVVLQAAEGRTPGVSACVVPGWVVVGDPSFDGDRGAVLAFREAALRAAGPLDLDAAADAVWTGANPGDRLGAGLSCHDVDDDGRGDVLVGAPGWDLDGATGDHGVLWRLVPP